MRAPWHRVGIVVVLAAVGLVSGLALYFSRDWNPYGKRPFDSHAWRATSMTPDGDCPAGNPRRGMVRDLLDHHLRPGALRGRVQFLLGKPDVTSEKSSVERYSLACIGPAGSDLEKLKISYDSSGRLISAEVTFY